MSAAESILRARQRFNPPPRTSFDGLVPAIGNAGRAFYSFVYSRLPAPLSRPAAVGEPARLLQLAPPRAPQENSPRRTVLAIGAHPDDVEIGCGGTLASHAARGDRLVVLTLSSGECAGRPEARAAESRAAADQLGAELVLGNLTDTRISEGPATIEAIEDVVRRVNPTTVYVHSSADRHQDHRNVHRAAMVATRSVPSVYCYQSPSTTTEFRPHRFTPVTDFIDEKLDLLAYYDSQTGKDYLAPERIKATAIYWSRFAKAAHVEPFEVIREQGEI